MATAKHLRRLIETGANGNLDEFSKVAGEVIKEERMKNHHLLANDLEKILYGQGKDITRHPHWKETIPVDREKGLPMISVVEPQRDLNDLVLSDENRSIIEEILQEYNYSERLASYGMKPMDKILFYGPPGTGKTLAAGVLAMELGRELAILRVDSVVSSFLGETASNLRTIFEFIETYPFVVLLDEFDAIGRERSDTSEHGEIKRVVNAFLQMMDGYKGKSILVAATNHEGDLDKAVWRRFDDVLRFDLPNLEQIRKLFEIKLRGVRRNFELDDPKIITTLKGMSYADIERVIKRAIKEMILSGKEFLETIHINIALKREESRQRAISNNG